ncbi:SIMPL domain-containing protein [Reichenbachiella agariperforans]|uniref:SIMPL domain-containing protein n=1 Tax=Reichenbachiella agariperforans TaxID=156994 RepID=UPI001C0A0E06|nr:SIMPL domain-containing protein [Reichenbachiella agariperforans]MBU2913571.1 SIMPL domain-containing protein [Reichenbachiella agariperforans]
MKHILTTLLCLSIGLMAQAQTESTIQVTGQSEVATNPQIAVFTYRISANEKNYDTAVETMNTRVNSLIGQLKKSGFKEEEIKTSQFNIRESKIYNQGKVSGEEYIASQTLVVKFAYDVKKLLNVLNTTTAKESAPNLSISFELSEAQKELTRTVLLKAAMKDALEQAEILSLQAGYEIKGVKEISHYANNAQPMAKTMEFDMVRSMADSNTSSYQPSDMVVTDQVSVTYIIVKKS